MAYRINDIVYIEDNINNVINDIIVVKLEDDITEISTIKETESEINTKLDVIIDSIDELNTLNFDTTTCELSRESFIYSLSKLGYSYNEITISIEDWESFKSGEFKIYTKKLGSYTKVFHEDSDILKRNLKNSIKETHTKIEQRNEINSIKVISHTLEILNKKMIATCISNYFWNLRSCMRVIEFMSYQYVNKK